MKDNKLTYVTEVFVTEVVPENDLKYRKWIEKIQKVESQFPGYQGAYIYEPEKGKSDHWVTVLRFDTIENLDFWLTSKERKAFLSQADGFVKKLHTYRGNDPFAAWFPKKSAIWKESMLVLLVLFPIVMLELKFLNPHLAHLNRSLATFIGNAISVTLISWPTLPLAIYFLKWWLPRKVSPKTQTMGLITVLLLYLLSILLFWHFL